MFSRSSSFSSAEDLDNEAATTSVYPASCGQLTVQELITFLQDIVQKDPSMRDASVFHIEFGQLTATTHVEATKGVVVLSE